MTDTAVINIQTDTETKTAIEEIYSAFGISISDAVNIFFKKSIMQNGLPFSMQLPRYNAETLAAVAEVQEIKKNPHLYKGFHSVQELFEDLNNDDEI
ncbi:MAG: type II toxin-antitoxin system RelB/DinJ family antitoxin [Defluviitaleaceae bacterium]|nr:type II toxin-antitoxin system RelB/DinJ family antitoxin [Defluviitaleaceae bacterium]